MATWGILAYLASAKRARRRLSALPAATALGVGLATVYLGTHWLSDVLLGWVMGLLILLALPWFEPLITRTEAWILDRSEQLRTWWWAPDVHGAPEPAPRPGRSARGAGAAFPRRAGGPGARHGIACDPLAPRAGTPGQRPSRGRLRARVSHPRRQSQATARRRHAARDDLGGPTSDRRLTSTARANGTARTPHHPQRRRSRLPMSRSRGLRRCGRAVSALAASGHCCDADSPTALPRPA
ncbi:phosphatase PAP2 family protein [Streptomyces coeruleorubidus]|uniref:phosphatase PAP2 family protein n=1 Tax=Streptomyces coeruleorubidus TaxID=116188 RepID=UPI003F540C4B